MIQRSNKIFLDIPDDGYIVFGGYINFTSEVDNIKDIKFKVYGESRDTGGTDIFNIDSSYTHLKELLIDDNNLCVFGILNSPETHGFFTNEYSSISISYVIEMNDGELYEDSMVSYGLGNILSETDGYINKNIVRIDGTSSSPLFIIDDNTCFNDDITYLPDGEYVNGRIDLRKGDDMSGTDTKSCRLCFDSIIEDNDKVIPVGRYVSEQIDISGISSIYGSKYNYSVNISNLYNPIFKNKPNVHRYINVYLYQTVKCSDSDGQYGGQPVFGGNTDGRYPVIYRINLPDNI